MRTFPIAVILLAASMCYGQGFLFDALDARSLAMGSAPFTSGTGASLLFLNPASAAARPGLFMNVAGELVLRQGEFSGTYSPPSGLGIPSKTFNYETDNGVAALPSIGFAYAPSFLPFGFGISVAEPFHMNTIWPASWPGNESLERFGAHAVYTTLAMGYRVNRMMAVGGAVNVVTGGFNSMQQVSDNDPLGHSTLLADGAGSSASMSVSAIVTPAQQFAIGLGYSTGTNIPLKGKTQSIYASTTTEGSYHSLMALPSMLTFSMDIHPTMALRIDAGVQFIGWEGFTPLELVSSDSTMRSHTVGFNCKNTFALHAGLEFLLSRSLALRAGVGYATSPVKEDADVAFFPDAAAFQYSAGIGYSVPKSNIRFDLAYRGAAFGSRNGAISSYYFGEYAPSAHLIAASIALAIEPTANPLQAPGTKK